MSQRTLWSVVALGMLLGLVVGGIAGYAFGVNTNPAEQPAASVRTSSPSDSARPDAPEDAEQPTVSDKDICQASDVYDALDIFGRNAQNPVTAATLTQLRKAADVFDRAAALAKDADLVAALKKLAKVSSSVQAGDSYTFGPYDQFSTACSGSGL